MKRAEEAVDCWASYGVPGFVKSAFKACSRLIGASLAAVSSLRELAFLVYLNLFTLSILV